MPCSVAHAFTVGTVFTISWIQGWPPLSVVLSAFVVVFGFGHVLAKSLRLHAPLGFHRFCPLCPRPGFCCILIFYLALRVIPCYPRIAPIVLRIGFDQVGKSSSIHGTGLSFHVVGFVPVVPGLDLGRVSE